MIQEAIRQVVDGQDLSFDACRTVMCEMMDGTATDSQTASFVTAMRMKGETSDEIKGFVTAMRARSGKVIAPEGAVDLCGTGGDCSGTFNISTVASFIVAAAGVPVAKHGNRSVSSRAGSADLIDALGMPIDLGAEAVQRCLDGTSLGFMFAPIFHSSMRNVARPRQEIGIRTFFNTLGPMTNPANVKNQLIGVYDPKLAAVIAEVLIDTGTSRALIVHGSGMDEITNIGSTRIVEIKNEATTEYDVSPEDFGFDSADPEDIRGGTPSQNARSALSILRGEESPRSDVVAMNAGAAIYVSGKAATIEQGIEIASDALENGSGLRKLREYAALVGQIEMERQAGMMIGDLSSRRILPEVLLQRCPEISAHLFHEASKIDSAKRLLASLDESIISAPSILSVLTLNRILRIASEGLPDILPQGRSTRRLSESIGELPGISVIGEYKPRSPSSRPLIIPPDQDEAGRIFGSSGLAGVSVLVEPDYFSGSVELFSSFRSKIQMPMLFKDFVVSEHQLRIAQTIGADAVLLIAKALKKEALDWLVRSCLECGMEPLIEIHDRADAEKLLSCETIGSIKLIGVNCRDLRNLEINRSVLAELSRTLPRGKTLVAESGVESGNDVRALAGFDAVLVGSMLMRSEDIESTTRELVAAGRSVAQ